MSLLDRPKDLLDGELISNMFDINLPSALEKLLRVFQPNLLMIV